MLWLLPHLEVVNRECKNSNGKVDCSVGIGSNEIDMNRTGKVLLAEYDEARKIVRRLQAMQ